MIKEKLAKALREAQAKAKAEGKIVTRWIINFVTKEKP